MRLISHRGNLYGPNPDLENSPSYIDSAISLGFDVEVDVWMIDDQLMLGHDFPQYLVKLDWLESRSSHLWIHCKNIDAIVFFSKNDAFYGLKSISLNFFWHETDRVTLTSKGAIWAFPGGQPIYGSIAVMPEIHNDDITDCFGVCSDFVMNYK